MFSTLAAVQLRRVMTRTTAPTRAESGSAARSRIGTVRRRLPIDPTFKQRNARNSHG